MNIEKFLDLITALSYMTAIGGFLTVSVPWISVK
jgi:hypothetical protein